MLYDYKCMENIVKIHKANMNTTNINNNFNEIIFNYSILIYNYFLSFPL